MTMKQLLMAATCAAVMTGLSAEQKPIDEGLPPAEGWSPVGFAFLPVRYLQCPGVGSDVNGLRLGLLAGHNRQVNGFDIGTLGSWADGEINGLSCSGLGNCCEGATFGIHLSGIVNYATGTINGCQFATVNSACTANGFQVGVVNCVSDGGGFQVGVWNMAESWSGFQLGLVNTAMNYRGVQVGLGNVIGSSPLTACVFVNAWF